jgi:hypothetical protein
MGRGTAPVQQPVPPSLLWPSDHDWTGQCWAERYQDPSTPEPEADPAVGEDLADVDGSVAPARFRPATASGAPAAVGTLNEQGDVPAWPAPTSEEVVRIEPIEDPERTQPVQRASCPDPVPAVEAHLDRPSASRLWLPNGRAPVREEVGRAVATGESSFRDGGGRFRAASDSLPLSPDATQVVTTSPQRAPIHRSTVGSTGSSSVPHAPFPCVDHLRRRVFDEGPAPVFPLAWPHRVPERMAVVPVDSEARSLSGFEAEPSGPGAAARTTLMAALEAGAHETWPRIGAEDLHTAVAAGELAHARASADPRDPVATGADEHAVVATVAAAQRGGGAAP